MYLTKFHVGMTNRGDCQVRRLFKKASMITLYHGTSMDAFIEICEADALLPYGETNNDNGAGEDGGGYGGSNTDGVYLTNDSGDGYADLASNDAEIQISVVIGVTVDTTKLLPDWDNYEPDFEDGAEIETSTYEDSLEQRDQCIYVGAIPASQFTTITMWNNGEDEDMAARYGLTEDNQVVKLSYREAKQIVLSTD